MSFGPHTVTVLARGWDQATRDRHNNPVISILDTYVLEECFLQQRGTDEDLNARDSTDTTWLLVAPPVPAGKTVGHQDQYRIDATEAATEPDPGETYATFEQDGHPDQVAHIDGQIHHLELILRRVKL